GRGPRTNRGLVPARTRRPGHSGGRALMAAIVIQPTRGWRRLRLRELWESRELLWFLVWRDVKVRYKQTAFGVAWAVLQPLVMMAHYGVHVSARLAVLPAFVLLGILTLFAVGILFASLNVRYRDVKYAVTAMLQAWLFLSPVVYPASLIPSPLRAVYGLNP